MSRYSGGIIDAHHHYWEPGLGRQPWLRPGVTIPFRYGDYEPIKRDYLPPDLDRDAAGLNLVGSVTMETEWDPSDPVGEADYLDDLLRRFGRPDASIARAFLNGPNIEAMLDALVAHPIVRGIRHKPGQSGNPAEPQPTLLGDPAWQRGFAALGPRSLAFELQTAWWQLDEAAALFARHPEIQVVVNHAGLPADRSAEALAGWRAAIGRIARLPHVAMKISGIGLRGVPWIPQNNRPIVEGVAEAFGPDRIMFASNFPVDSLVGSYADIYNGFLDLTAGWSRAEQHAAFAGNAMRIYRLPPTLAAAPVVEGTDA
jgi:Predicted metal-dependent hydrolase of the TIM-barrel fold